MANSNEIITAPVSMYDVQQVLGDNSTDLATLCKSSKINKWSPKKPIYYPSQSSPKIQPLTDAEFRNQNYGLVIDNSRANYAAEVVRLSANQVDFRYVPVNAPYRLSDFNGYDHSMGSWFTLDIDHNTYIDAGSAIPCSFRYENLGFDLDFFSKMEFYGGGNQHDWCVGFIMNPTDSWNTGTRTCWVSICGRIDEVLSDDKFRIYTSPNMPIGNYYVMPVIFSESSVDSSRLNPGGEKVFQSSMNDIITGDWRYMPTRALNSGYPPMLTLTSNPAPHPTINATMVIGTQDSALEYYYLSDYIIKFISLPVTITIDDGIQDTFDVTFKFNGGNSITRTGVRSGEMIDIAPVEINTDPILAEDAHVNLEATITASSGAYGVVTERIIE